jgi:hypothetical protein
VPAQNPFVYPGLAGPLTAPARAPAARNGFYGDGIVNADAHHARAMM